MSLVYNERVKLTASALDRASTACLAVGVFGPALAVLYGLGSTGTAGGPTLVLGTAFWLSAALAGLSDPEDAPVTWMWVFAYVILPIVVVAMGYAATLLTATPPRGPAE